MHPRERLLQRLVVGWQIAVAVVLLSGAALFVRSVRNLDRTPLGFDASGLVAFELFQSATTWEGSDQFYDAVRARVEALPHVTGTGAVLSRPLSGPIGYDSIPALEGTGRSGAGRAVAQESSHQPPGRDAGLLPDDWRARVVRP